MVALISEAEKAYIALGCQQNVREDGRTSMDFRCVRRSLAAAVECGRMQLSMPGLRFMAALRVRLCLRATVGRSFTVENDVLPHTNGSARVIVGGGVTDVLAAVKVSQRKRVVRRWPAGIHA